MKLAGKSGLALGAIALALCGAAPAPDTTELEARTTPGDPIADALRFDLPEPGRKGRKHDLWATYYYVPEVDHRADGHALRTMSGAVLPARLSQRDWCEAAMQGTVLVEGAPHGGAAPSSGAHTFNYAGVRDDVQVDCTPIYPRHPAIGRSRFAPAVGPWGDGVEDMILIPYRSIAVDPNTIPFGSAVYIPAARGNPITLPDGSEAKHDGWFYAADRGGAIKGEHIDVFVGVGRHNPFESWVKSRSRATFVAYVAPRLSEATERLRRAHRRP